MLIRFVLSNFLSFGQECEFNMLPAPLKSHQNHLHYNATKRLKVLKGAAIYGANGAGKSNLVRGLSFLKDAVVGGGIAPNMSLVKFKLDDEIKSKPTVFDVEYEWKRKFYGYHLEIQNDIILEESLYELGIQNEDKMLFERTCDLKTYKISVTLAKKIGTASKTKLLEELLEKNILTVGRLLLSNHQMLKNAKISNAFSWFYEGLQTLFPNTKYTGMAKALSDSVQFNDFTNSLITTLDTGVSQISVNEIPFEDFFRNDPESKGRYEYQLQKTGTDIPVQLQNGNIVVASLKPTGEYVIKKPVTYHKDSSEKNILFDVSEESDGTQRLLDIIPAINMYLRGVTVLIDEVDESLHPSLLKAIMLKVMDSEPAEGGQFIVTTHESNLLDYDIFRQDEIWFVEKHNGSTELYPLTDFKPRADLQIQKGYLMGRFGAIPFLANLKDLKWQ